MADDSENHLEYFLLIERSREEELASLRGWVNISLAREEDMIWLKGFTETQIESIEVKVIPFVRAYYARNGSLYPLHKQLPERSIPSLSWDAIAASLPLVRPAYNDHFFGINDQLIPALVPSETEHEPVGMMVMIADLLAYTNSAPAIRLEPMIWTAINNDKAFVVGAPVLPVRGDVYWYREGIFIPSGFELNYTMLAKEIYQSIEPDETQWLIWNTDQSYSRVPKNVFTRLSRSSVRESVVKYALSHS